jgi:hypothetical protein
MSFNFNSKSDLTTKPDCCKGPWPRHILQSPNRKPTWASGNDCSGVWLCIPHREIQGVHTKPCSKVRLLSAGVEREAKLTTYHNYRNQFNWFVGFTRSSCNFCQIVNSLPAFVEEAYFRHSGPMDIVQCIANSFHHSVFGHSSVLVVRSEGNFKRVVMQKFSRSTATALSIPLPECSNCREDRFLEGRIYSGNQLNVLCKGCNTRAVRISLPSEVVFLNTLTKKGVFSLLPFPPSNSLLNSLKINWPQTRQSVKQQAKPRIQETISGSTWSKDKSHGKVRTLYVFYIYLVLRLLDSFATFVKMSELW